VPALEPVDGWRAVASPEALDSARWLGDAVDVLRVAPDEALGLGARGVQLDDPDAIAEPEAGFSVALLTLGELVQVRRHVDWDLDGAGPVAQGKIAGVPAKLVGGEPSILVVQTAYADELRSRLGW
jgi:hypothetical protein